mgnify:CR=1 FL=1
MERDRAQRDNQTDMQRMFTATEMATASLLMALTQMATVLLAVKFSDEPLANA